MISLYDSYLVYSHGLIIFQPPYLPFPSNYFPLYPLIKLFNNNNIYSIFNFSSSNFIQITPYSYHPSYLIIPVKSTFLPSSPHLPNSLPLEFPLESLRVNSQFSHSFSLITFPIFTHSSSNHH
jgi:hypothetical protein